VRSVMQRALLPERLEQVILAKAEGMECWAQEKHQRRHWPIYMRLAGR
jgi:hypothetical protein